MSDTDIIIFTSNADKINDLFEKAIKLFLEDSASSLEEKARENTTVKSGRTRDTWRHEVSDEGRSAVVGNTLENSVWEEFGTGEYALSGNGRKDGWVYKDDEGFHHTYGKPPKRPLFNAFMQKRPEIENKAKAIFGEVFL